MAHFGRLAPLSLSCILLGSSLAVASAAEPEWTRAADQKAPPTAAEAAAFMKRLAQNAVDHHMKKAENAPQRGMMYEYLWWKKRGQPGQFVEGEALDTMHDGAWFACAMVNAYRATGDPYYKEVLVRSQLPFYLKMINHSAELFSDEKTDVLPEFAKTWKESKEWLVQGRENGFVPYWWDDGESVSLEMAVKKVESPLFPCTNLLSGQPNPEHHLKGYSHGCSNHMAQDLGVMLLQAWWMLHDSSDSADQSLAKDVALAAKNLEEGRTRHGSPNIPAVLAAYAVTNGDAAALGKVPAWDRATPDSKKAHYINAVRDFKPDAKVATPGFADDSEYIYYSGVARHRAMPHALALKLAYDAFTAPLLWQLYSDDAPVPPGINHFDLYPFFFVNGKPSQLRSQRKGPSGRPIPIGSRMGPQNMVVCGWALQALKQGGAFEAIPSEILQSIKGLPGADLHPDVKAWMERELGGGLRTWEAIFAEYGYIPTGIGCQSAMPGAPWDEFSDTGGYAHLISAASQWILYLDGKKDWELSKP